MSVTMTIAGQSNVVHIVDHGTFADVLVSCGAPWADAIAVRVREYELDDFIEQIEKQHATRQRRLARIRQRYKSHRHGRRNNGNGEQEPIIQGR